MNVHLLQRNGDDRRGPARERRGAQEGVPRVSGHPSTLPEDQVRRVIEQIIFFLPGGFVLVFRPAIR